MTDPISAFLDHMRSVGCGPASGVEINPDDKWHRYQLDGDKPKTQNGSYKLKLEPDGFAVGVCINFREQVPHGWHVKAARKSSAEDRAAWKAKADAERKRQAQESAEQATQAAERARGIWSKLTPDQTPYLDKKRLSAASCNVRARGDLCVVPMWSGWPVGWLAVHRAGWVKEISARCSKGRVIPRDQGDDAVVVICEGMATGGAIHAALGCMVVVAFDAGNLKPVALAIRKRKPDARLVIAADADQWTIPAHQRPQPWDDPAGDDPRWHEWRDAGLTVNTGRDKALDAAVAIGGAVVVHPPVASNDPSKRTDFWDVWATDGPDAVRDAFDRAMNPPQRDDYPEPEYLPPEPEPPQENPLLAMVRPLGRNGKVFYFFRARQAR
jgi:putative DNA primase/helicase